MLSARLMTTLCVSAVLWATIAEEPTVTFATRALVPQRAGGLTQVAQTILIRPTPSDSLASGLDMAVQARTARIRGVVTADSGVPLGRALVRLHLAGAGEGLTATTDRNGRYEFGELEPGNYTLSASKGGYVTLQYGQDGAFELDRAVELGSDQVVDGINFTLSRGGVIAGRIIDEFGEPIANSIVQALHHDTVRGRRRLRVTSTARANDLGQFRLFGLAPANYYVVAAVQGLFLDSVDSGKSFVYPSTFYPGTKNPSEAEPIAVLPAQEAVADFTLAAVRPVRVRGSITNSLGRPVTEGSVRLEYPRGPYSFPGGPQGRIGRLHGDGSFVINGVVPGDYTLIASTSGLGRPSTNEVAEMGRVSITVGTDNLSDILVSTSPGAVITGTVVVEEGRSTEPISAVQVFADLLDLSDDSPARIRTATTAENGTFELQHLFGRSLIYAIAPSGAYVKRVFLNTQDVTDSGVEPTPRQQLQGVRIVLATPPAEVFGVVTNGNGQPTGDSVVLMFADDEKKWEHPLTRYIKLVRPDREGKYSSVGLPQGDYRAIALRRLDTSESTDITVLKRLKKSAQLFRLTDSEQKNLDLHLSISK